jgi:hypothetical protein
VFPTISVKGGSQISVIFREKSTLKKTLCKSAWITVRYHLGTAVVGSIIISLLRIVKFPVRRIRIHHRDSRLAVYLTRLKECTEYLSKKSYIMTGTIIVLL